MKLIKKNKTNKDCGIVAAFNAASWCNLYKPYNEIEMVAKSCGYNKEIGIYPFQFDKLVRKLNIPAKKVRFKSLEELESNIYLGKFYCLLYNAVGYETGHVAAAFMDHKGNIKIINPNEDWPTWNDLASEIYANGMKEFHVYEIPSRSTFRRMVKNNDA